MIKHDPIQRRLRNARFLPWLVILASLLLLAGAILFTTQLLRQRIREQMAGRDGEVLNAVALMHAEAVTEEFDDLGDLRDPANQLLILLQTSRLHQVLGARLFHADGQFVEGFPAGVRESRLGGHDLPALHRLKAVSRFHPSMNLSELFYHESLGIHPSKQPLPVLEINVPLHQFGQNEVLGVAQFLIEGQSLAAEYARLDGHLLMLAGVAFLLAGSLISITFAAAFRRLRKTQDLLTERTRHLYRANQDLTLAATTSALGAVTAHLIHGLKNPLAGLQNYVANLGRAQPAEETADWQQAVASTRRMQSLINQVVQVLREQQSAQSYEMTLPELIEMLRLKTDPLARQWNVALTSHLQGEAVLTNREANLIALILVNLLHNAIQATPAGGCVELTATAQPHDGQLIFQVRDQGPGFPEMLKGSLFSPCHSTKEGGSGLGLAISKVLAGHLGADLELSVSDSTGCQFELRLPLSDSTRGKQSEVASQSGVG